MEEQDGFFNQTREKSHTLQGGDDARQQLKFKQQYLKMPDQPLDGTSKGDKISPRPRSGSHQFERKMRGRPTPSQAAASHLNGMEQKQREIEDTFAQLKHLPKQKLHPFDLRPEELDSIKQHFPEFKNAGQQSGEMKRAASKMKGMPLEQLKDLLKEKIAIPSKAMRSLIDKLDHKDAARISWTEFLDFLNLEGIRREIVNDAQLYGFGVKRLVEKERVSMKQNQDQQVEYYIDQMIILKSSSFRLVLSLFENNEAKLYDTRNWKMIQEIKFPSDYAVPKQKKECSKNHSKDQQISNMHHAPGQGGSQAQPYLGSSFDHTKDVSETTSINRTLSGVNQPYLKTFNEQSDKGLETIVEKKGRKPSATTSLYQRHSGGARKLSKLTTNSREPHRSKAQLESIQLTSQLSQSHSRKQPSSPISSHKQKNSSSQNTRLVVTAAPEAQRRTSILSNISFVSGSRLGAKVAARPLSSQSHVAIKPALQPNARPGYYSIPQKKQQQTEKQLPSILSAKSSSHAGDNYSTTQKPSRAHSSQISSAVGGARSAKLLTKSKLQRAQSATSEEDSGPRVKASEEVAAWRDDPYHLGVAAKKAAKQRDADAKARKKIYVHLIGELPVNKIMGMVDLTTQESQREQMLKEAALRDDKYDQADSTARRQFRVKDLKPHFKSEGKDNYAKFTEKVAEVEREIKEKELDKEFMKLYEAALAKNAERERQAHLPIPFVRMNELDCFRAAFLQMRYNSRACYTRAAASVAKRFQDILDDRKVMEKAFLKSTAKHKEGRAWLGSLKEINRYFYRMNPLKEVVPSGVRKKASVTPGTSTTASTAPGSEVEMSQDPNVCTHEMIVHFVDGLKKAKEEERPDPTYSHLDMSAVEKPKNTDLAGETRFEQNRRKMIKNTKAVFVQAADYSEEMGLLALALIDREVKIYYIKQNGTKIALLELFSFKPKFQHWEKDISVSKVAKEHMNSPISSLQLDRFVTNNRDIIILSSYLGDIAIYYIDEVNEKGKKHAKLLKAFNFLDQGPSKRISQQEDQHEEIEDDDQSTVRFTFTGGDRPDMSYFRHGSDQDSNKHNKTNEQKKMTPGGLLVDSMKQIQDDYWEILMTTGGKKEGLDGITLWNQVTAKIKDNEQASRLCKELVAMKFEDEPDTQQKNYFKETANQKVYHKVSNAIDIWQLCNRICGGNLEETIDRFRQEMKRTKQFDDQKLKNQNDDRKSSIASSIKGLKTVQKRKLNAKASSLKRESPAKDKKESGGDQMKNLRGKDSHEITKIRYVRDIGLIAANFRGMIKIFDAFNFHQIWKNDNKMRAPAQHTNIRCFDVSGPLGIMATGGVEGNIVLIDPYALGIVNAVEAHKATEILQVFIFAEQQQIISVAKDRTVSIWDAFRLERIQTIKDVGTSNILSHKFTSATFDSSRGLLYVGCQEVSVWQAQVDSKVEISALQVQTLSENLLKERNMQALLELTGSRTGAKLTTDKKSGKVLISSQSTLVEIIINETDASGQNVLITVDSENLLRGWSFDSATKGFSYRVDIRKRVTAAAVDRCGKHLGVGNCEGDVRILNFKSGGLLYSLPHQDHEITCLEFLAGSSEFWLAAGCWRGKIVLWTEPNEGNNFQVTAKCRIGHRDDSDVLCIDSGKTYFVTGGVDGLLSVWNQFSGVLKYAVQMPSPNFERVEKRNVSSIIARGDEERQRALQASSQIRSCIVGLLIHPYYSNLVCVLQEGGSIHIAYATNGMVVHDFVAHVKVNSNWACDKVNSRVFVVGDLGKATLFDISMGDQPAKISRNHKTDRTPIYVAKGDFRWKQVRPWLIAHQISKMDSHYVNAVKFVPNMGIFVSGTSTGEVKLWSSHELQPLGTLNSPMWLAQVPALMKYIKKQKAADMEVEDL